jgi:uncharacterized protein (DUF885 family)
MKKLFFLFSIAILVFLTSCQQDISKNDNNDSSKELHTIFDEEWEFRSKDDNVELLPDVTSERKKKDAEFWKGTLEKLAKIDRNQLTKKDRINYDIFKYQLEDKVARIGFEDYLMPLNAEGGFYTNISYMVRGMSFENADDYEKYLKKLQAVPQFFDDNIALMRLGMQKGITQPKVIVKNYKALIKSYLVDAPAKSSFYGPFSKMNASVPEELQTDLKKRAQQIILAQVLPAYQKFDQFMEDEYVPQARNSLIASDLPKGKEYYEQRVQFFTTLPMTSDEIFELGKKEVARIRADMEKVIEELGFKGNFADFLVFLRTDPQFYAKTPKDLLKEASFLAKKMDGKLPQFFNTLPRNSYGVEPVPAAIAPNYTSGRYSGGSLENHQAGNYWVNTYKLESRPLYVLPALTLHEAVPGHHLQISLAQELEGFPEFRKNTYLSCYGEGWGLYSEYLGIEAGMYETPYENFGRMTYEMWRACRLVVDVGIHAKGWTRDQAVEFLGSNTALSLHEVNTEIDRYIGWPGQALSYKMGELKIRELRKKAETELGNKFDLRDFHDVVLLNGAVPLFVLEELVNDWIGSVKSAS